ncbi:hypothetical protein ABTZ78_08415 [Streptomyces bauhiniae]|uniref:hypothetical protein n=1 Tax=Streptomyces bauhiniae TaxID=2340725 RepID=UPI00333323D9
MEPISAGLLVAIATGAAGEAGKQLWERLAGMIRRPPAEPSDTPTGDTELVALAQSPGDRARAQALGDVLARRAQGDEAFRADLMQWRQQAQNLRTGDGDTHNVIRGSTHHAPVLQGRDFSGVNFNLPK